MTSRQASELDFAFERNGWTSEDVKKVSGGDLLATLLLVVRGMAEVVIKSLLELVAKTTVTLTERHDPNAFYQNRSGLFVWSEFRSLVVAKTKSSEAGATHNVQSYELTRDAVDEEIEGSLPKDHLFDETTVCAVIASLIAQQPNGKEGVLLNNGYANLFYMGSCVVDVVWDAGGGEWYVSAWQRDDYRWFAGGLVFSPGN